MNRIKRRQAKKALAELEGWKDMTLAMPAHAVFHGAEEALNSYLDGDDVTLADARDILAINFDMPTGHADARYMWRGAIEELEEVIDPLEHCPACSGEGHLPDEEGLCPLCEGSGEIEDTGIYA